MTWRFHRAEGLYWGKAHCLHPSPFAFFLLDMAGERHWGCPNTQRGCCDLKCLRDCPGCALEAKTWYHPVREVCASALGPPPRIPPLAFRTLALSPSPRAGQGCEICRKPLILRLIEDRCHWVVSTVNVSDCQKGGSRSSCARQQQSGRCAACCLLHWGGGGSGLCSNRGCSSSAWSLLFGTFF